MQIDLTGPGQANTATTPQSDLIKDTGTAGFSQDVIEISKQVPVLVDFWAPWCGPCRQLGPAIERVVTELGGKIRLVKVNVDENQALAGQMGVQSIPAVFAFAGGKPVDGFMGALPENELRKFAQKVIDAAPAGSDGAGTDDASDGIAAALEAAGSALDENQLDRATEIFELVLQHAPGNAAALLGLARVQLKGGDLDAARATLDKLPKDERTKPAAMALDAALNLAAEAGGLDEAGVLETKLAANPNDHQARFDLGLVLNAAEQRIEAAEALVGIMRRDRGWNDDAARKKLVELFEAWGPKDPATARGRKLLSSVLFS